ncbi:MAG TPA: response regulator transcription factor [Planctomycetaceae bacterium]|nr:response regulator transcription factor [Planctomycetaceae bacterium]
MPRILIVEDEEAMARGLKFNLELEGYEVVVAGDGPQALERIHSDPTAFDVIVLDLMLPGMSGYEVCRTIRQTDELVPIIVLSARSLSEDRALAFDCGTDQYVTKPFDLRELLTRVRKLIERRQRFAPELKSAPPATERGGVAAFGGVRVDFGKHELTVGAQRFEPTARELELLAYFIEHEGYVLSRAQILEDVWRESAEITTRTVDNFVLRLRKMIEPDPAEPQHILSVRGTGYRFVANRPDAAGQGIR